MITAGIGIQVGAGSRPADATIIGNRIGVDETSGNDLSRVPSIGVSLVAGIDTRPQQLKDFCDKHAIPNGFASIQDAIASAQG